MYPGEGFVEHQIGIACAERKQPGAQGREDLAQGEVRFTRKAAPQHNRHQPGRIDAIHILPTDLHSIVVDQPALRLEQEPGAFMDPGASLGFGVQMNQHPTHVVCGESADAIAPGDVGQGVCELRFAARKFAIQCLAQLLPCRLCELGPFPALDRRGRAARIEAAA